MTPVPFRRLPVDGVGAGWPGTRRLPDVTRELITDRGAYMVMFYEQHNPGRKFTARLGSGSISRPPTPKAGGGGWQPQTLPKRSAVTVWQARDQLLTMDVPILVGDGPGGVMPAPIPGSRLWEMWRPADPTAEPPTVRIKSPGTAVPFQNLVWVIQDLAWSDSQGDTQGDEHGNRMLSGLTVTLLEYRPDERLQTTTIKRPSKKKHKGTHHVKANETLGEIAAGYGLASWQDIAMVQVPPIQDPRQIVPGQLLQIPARPAP